MADAIATNGAAPMEIGQQQALGRRSNLEDFARAEHITTAAGLSLTVAIVADGVGGNAHGEVAAEMSVETIFAELQASSVAAPTEIPQLLKQVLEKANTAVYQRARQERDKRGMGTTVTVVAICQHKLYLANVGDSRIYLVRDGKTVQLTRDHTWAREMVLLGRVLPEDAVNHPKAEELVRSIGYEPNVLVDLGLYVNGVDTEAEATAYQGYPLQANDRLLLCSDGLIKVRREGALPFVTDEEIVRTVTQRAPQIAADRLVETAVKRQADDNVTAIVLEMPNSKRAFYLPPPVLYGGVAVLIGLLIVGIFFFLGGSPEPTPTVESLTGLGEPTEVVVPTDTAEPTMTPTEVIEVPDGFVQVVAAGSGSRWQAGDEEAIINGAGEIALPIDVNNKLQISNGTNRMHLVLPDDTHLFLDDNTTIVFETISGIDGETETAVILQQGRLVMQAAPLTNVAVQNPFGARINTTGGMLGVFYSDSPFRFEGGCLQGNCEIKGDIEGGIQLVQGQASIVGGNGKPETAVAAPYELYAPLTSSVPTPTTTPSPSPTLTATPTATPTNTIAAPLATVVPSPTATFAVVATPHGEPEDSGGNSGGGDDDNDDTKPPAESPGGPED